MQLYIRDIQRLLAVAGYYKGGIDNTVGRKTLEAVEKILNKHSSLLTSSRMNDKRRLIASAQIILHFAGFEPGVIDGYVGHNTVEAYNAWAYEKDHGKKEIIKRSFTKKAPSLVKGNWPYQSQVNKFYGKVGTNQTKVKIPYTMKLAWNTRQKVNKITVHEKIADSVEGIFKRTYEHYGQAKISKMRLDYFGGSLNVRKMRGGSKYSMHSWGIAIDLDPANNQLRWKSNRASFARPEYEEFWKIVESSGAISLGRARNFDWMHLQYSRI